MLSSRDKRIRYLILGITSLLSCGLFIAISIQAEGLGFPLDDAWIHQTFARNFAQSGRWSFQEGQFSGGSTGPLYGLILAVFYLLDINPIWGSYLLGFLSLWMAAIAGSELIDIFLPNRKWMPLAAGVLLSTEWHLVWAALSGMETMLLIVACLVVFILLYRPGTSWWLTGLLIGLTVWVRPDGVTLLGPAALVFVFRFRHRKDSVKQGLNFLASFIIPVMGYFIFNWMVAGDLWPNTFYAKQAEYDFLREAFFLLRYFRLCRQFLTGIGIVLLPGLAVELYYLWNNRNWTHLAALLWFLGYLGIYAWRLPVDYQHGRYLMPAMPLGFLLGVSGMFRFLECPAQGILARITRKAWSSSVAVVGLVFLLLGGHAYGMDVAVINSEMVAAAHWIKKHTEPDAVLAAHDIGALGYFADRKIIDLAGLVTPDVIPFIRDQRRLGNYLTVQGADYLVTFPSWYPELTAELEMIYQTGSAYSARFGMDNMAVYVWR